MEKILKNEVASLKKDHLTPPTHVIPVRRQILPAPTSKPSTQKMIQDSSNNQIKSKKLANDLHSKYKQIKYQKFTTPFTSSRKHLIDKLFENKQALPHNNISQHEKNNISEVLKQEELQYY